MKKSMQIPQYAFILLVVGFVLSLIVNGIQCAKNEPDAVTLQGTYSANDPSSGGIYVAFDNKGHFCIYNQNDGVAEEGNYTQHKENLYELKGVSGYCGYVVQTEDGIYFSTAGGMMDFLPRCNKVPIFVGNWAEDWDHWPQGPYAVG